VATANVKLLKGKRRGKTVYVIESDAAPMALPIDLCLRE
jgi:hypothetical protein